MDKVAVRLLAGIIGIFLEFKWLSYFYNWESETEHWAEFEQLNTILGIHSITLMFRKGLL